MRLRSGWWRVPLVVLCGQQQNELVTQEPLLSSNLVDLAKQYTKWAHEVRAPEEGVVTDIRRFTPGSSIAAGFEGVEIQFPYDLPAVALKEVLELTALPLVLINVPAGTQSGQVFHLRGRGLPRVNTGGVGDLHVRVQLWTPEEVSDEERTLLERLAAVQGIPPTERPARGFWSKMKEALGA